MVEGARRRWLGMYGSREQSHAATAFEVPDTRGAEAYRVGDEHHARNNGELHLMASQGLSHAGCSDTAPIDGSQPMGRTMNTLAVFAAVLSIDLVTKAWADAALTEPVRIADWLYLMLHHNSGLFLGMVPVSAGYWVCVCAATGWFGWRALRSTSTPVAVCLATALAGLAGNAVGQAQGAVVDFIGIGPITGNMWLVVNVADLALVGGVFVLGIYLIRARVRRAYRA